VGRLSIEDVRAATYKQRDSWWTVFLVDPYASRLVRLVAGYRWVTPNRLTILGTVLGLAAAGCFEPAGRWWLVAGAALFHLSFVVDCMDGKLARLQGTGSVFGGWLDYVFDRFRVLVCAVALMGGQYLATDRTVYLALAFGVVVLDMFHYLDLLEISKVKDQMRRQLEAARGLPQGSEQVIYENSREFNARFGRWTRLRGALLHNRVRPRVVSGIEFQMAVFIVAPLIGAAALIPVTLLAGGLLTVFELAVVYKLWLATKAFGREMEAAARPATDPALTG
jgi:hypothetical protein